MYIAASYEDIESEIYFEEKECLKLDNQIEEIYYKRENVKEAIMDCCSGDEKILSELISIERSLLNKYQKTIYLHFKCMDRIYTLRQRLKTLN